MWNRIDLKLHGPQGIRVRVREEAGTLYVWVAGSEHPAHWWHHFLPGARRREIRAGGTRTEDYDRLRKAIEKHRHDVPLATAAEHHRVRTLSEKVMYT